MSSRKVTQDRGHTPGASGLDESLERELDAPLRHFNPYPEYKKSDVKWLGDIPVGWCVSKLKNLLERNDSGAWGKDAGPEGTPVLRSTDITLGGEWKIEDPARRHLTDRERLATLLKEGDLVVTKSSGSARHLGKTALATREVEELGYSFSNFMQRLRVAPGNEPRFAHRLLNSRIGRDQLNHFGSTTTGLANLNGKVIGSVYWPTAPIIEQRCIADFLDREIGSIDELMAKKKLLVDILNDKRITLITQAVTKGLNPNLPMKESHVGWLGEIPEHWDVVPTKFIARLESGHTPSRKAPEYWEDCTIPWFGLADVWQLRDGRQEYVDETNEKISALGLAHSAARLLPRGTVILSRTASVGFSAIMATDMATTQDFVNWVCGPRIRPEYLLYVLRSMTQEFQRITMGSTHQTIYMPDVARFCTPLPPLAEQDRIVRSIREQTKTVDALTDKVREAIDSLRELRSALISAAVTGKIDVRGEVA